MNLFVPVTHPQQRALPIRKRLLLLILIPTLGLLLIGAAIDFTTGVKPVQAAYDQALIDAALAVAAHVSTDTQGLVAVNLTPEAISVLRSDSFDSIYFSVVTANGEFVAGDRELPRVAATTTNPLLTDGIYHDEAIRLAVYRVESSSGPIAVTVAETLHKRMQIRRRLLLTVIAVDLFEMLAVFVLVWIGVRYGLAPLRALRDQIAQRSVRELKPLDVNHIPLELSELAEVINRLLTTVNDSSITQRQFLENAAHQLRTPLTGIQAQLELLIAEPAAQAIRERLVALHSATKRLAYLAQQLLALARSDQGANAETDFVRVDLAALVQSSVAEHVTSALNAGVDLGAELQPAAVHGIPWLLGELLSNLLDNAIKHTPRSGVITARCGVLENKAFLEVIDTGVGIPHDEQSRVADRFFRGQRARGNGSGLGLAIVAEIAHLHEAQLTIASGNSNAARESLSSEFAQGTSVRIDFLADTSASAADTATE